MAWQRGCGMMSGVGRSAAQGMSSGPFAGVGGKRRSMLATRLRFWRLALGVGRALRWLAMCDTSHYFSLFFFPDTVIDTSS